ncbi:MAG: glucosiduronase [Acidobacteria bacterium]|jgi:alpha-glucuronidase|nr:glucosiduronase [Acidobacteriota bacterium]
MSVTRRLGLFLVSVCLFASAVRGETGYDAWLRYEPADAAACRQYRETLPPVITSLGDGEMITSAREELIRGIRGMLGVTLRVEARIPAESAIVLGTVTDLHAADPGLAPEGWIGPEGYRLWAITEGNARRLVIAGADERGVLYGAFALLRKISLGASVADLNETHAPAAPIRWLNNWDVLGLDRSGAVTAGPGPATPRVRWPQSVLYENGHVREDLGPLNDYARLLASVGINGMAISNVNADRRWMTPEYYPELQRLAAALRRWGIRVVLPVAFGSPKDVGGLDTFDPLDPRVAAWWASKTDELYGVIPDMAGYVMKADSENQTGPSAYGRTIADAAKPLARALKPHGGLLLYRAFVYSHTLDWNDPKADRARAAYDNFHPLDGQFDDNVVIQTKNGPIDFQVREPASPLFSGLEKTSQAIELQIVQEYMGQGRHLVSLVPWWKDTLDFDMRVGGRPSPVKDILAGKVFNRPTGGYVGVTMTTMNGTWEASLFSQANLYGFGRLAWDADLSALEIIDEWTRQTFGNDPRVVRTINDMQLRSWSVYENYTGPLGLQTLTECCRWYGKVQGGGSHYGPAVESSERIGWGQWHRADEKGVGMDRTVATGTGFIGQYPAEAAAVFESLETCPDELLVFMHHVPYTHKLHSGKTVIQHIYDSHYDGAEAVEDYVRDWASLEGLIDEERYGMVKAMLDYQAGAAQLWRDAVAGWFWKTSGIPDAHGRVGTYPGRHEAESMTLDGYTPRKVTYWETASGETAVECAREECSASLRYEGAPGTYTLRLRYFDYPQGESHLRLSVAGQVVDEWVADGTFPMRVFEPDGSSSTRRVVSGVQLRPGDEIRIDGVPEEPETAALDYLEILPDGCDGSW